MAPVPGPSTTIATIFCFAASIGTWHYNVRPVSESAISVGPVLESATLQDVQEVQAANAPTVISKNPVDREEIQAVAERTEESDLELSKTAIGLYEKVDWKKWTGGIMGCAASLDILIFLAGLCYFRRRRADEPNQPLDENADSLGNESGKDEHDKALDRDRSLISNKTHEGESDEISDKDTVFPANGKGIDETGNSPHQDGELPSIKAKDLYNGQEDEKLTTDVPTPSRNLSAKTGVLKSDAEVLKRMAQLKEQCEVLSESKPGDDTNSTEQSRETVEEGTAPKTERPRRRRTRTDSEVKENMAARKAQCEVLGEGGGQSPVSPRVSARIRCAFPELAMTGAEGVSRRGTEDSEDLASQARRAELDAMRELERVKAELGAA